MARNSQTRDILSALSLACVLLTRIPMPTRGGAADLSRSAWAWPLIGLLVGALTALAATVALMLGFPPGLAAAVALQGHRVQSQTATRCKYRMQDQPNHPTRKRAGVDA